KQRTVQRERGETERERDTDRGREDRLPPSMSLTNKHFLSDEAMATRFTALSLGNDHRYSSNGLRPSEALMLPCRELVLWQARGRGVREAVNSLRDRKEQTDTAISPKEVKPKPAEEEMEF
uniref:Uncharacterized protein n=1 Tax=Callorhinchus milii TaxID=7868 RepID=A0A4W3GYF1_CALMI